MKYQVNVSINITPADPEGRWGSSMLSYYKQYEVTGENFADIAPRIDSVHAAIALVADPTDA